MKYFLFDIGKVLVDFDTEDFIREVAVATGRPVAPLTECDLQRIDEVEKGIISDAEYVDYLNQTHGLAWTEADLTAVWSKMFSLNPTGRELYKAAVDAGVPVYTLSNIAKHHVDAIENNWDGFFDGVTGLFMSYQMGSRKPEAAIYRQVLDQLGAEGAQCFFIDDRPENIEAARAEGIHAHQFIPENHAAIEQAAAEFFGLS